MSFPVQCSDCGQELTVPGALLFSPPDGGTCRKEHLCVGCYGEHKHFREALRIAEDALERFARVGPYEEGEGWLRAKASEAFAAILAIRARTAIAEYKRGR